MSSIDSGTGLEGLNSSDRNLERRLEEEVVTRIESYFDAGMVKALMSENPDKRVYVYSEGEVGTHNQPGFFSRYAPSVIFALNKGLPPNERRILYSSGRREYGKNKLAYLLSTIDKSIMHGLVSKQQMLSKVNNLNSASKIIGRPEFVMKEPDAEAEYSAQELIDILISVKRRASNLLRTIEMEDAKEFEEKRAEQHSLQYPKWFREKIGDNLRKIMLYGSSATGDGADFDNIFVVNELSKQMYYDLAYTRPAEEGKPVGVIFIEKDILTNYMLSNANSRAVASTGKLLCGERIYLPLDSNRSIIQKELYHAAMGTVQLRSGLNLIFKKGEDVIGKSGLIEFFLKIPRFTLGAFKSLEHYLKTGEYKFFEKEELLEILAKEFDYQIPELDKDVRQNELNYIQELFLYANKVNSQIIDENYRDELLRQRDEALILVEDKKDNIVYGRVEDKGLENKGLENRFVKVFDNERHTQQGDIIPVRILSYSDSYSQSVIAERI